MPLLSTRAADYGEAAAHQHDGGGCYGDSDGSAERGGGLGMGGAGPARMRGAGTHGRGGIGGMGVGLGPGMDLTGGLHPGYPPWAL